MDDPGTIDGHSGYSNTQLAVRETIREFARKEVAPGAQERDRTGALDYRLYRRLGDQACRLHDAGLPYAKEAAMTKLHCTEMAKRAADHAVQIFGGLGYMDDTPVSRYYRDIRAATIAEGTSEIQKHIIARELGCLA